MRGLSAAGMWNAIHCLFSSRASRCHALRCRVHALCYCTICTLSRPRRVLAPVQCFACEVRWQPSGGRIDMDIPRSRGKLPADFPVPDDLHILVRCFPKTGPVGINRIPGVFCQGVSARILLLNNLHHHLYHPPAPIVQGGITKPSSTIPKLQTKHPVTLNQHLDSSR